jgi:hypothetical protein
MKSIDFVTIVENVAQSLGEVQRLVSGSAYVLGLILIYIAIMKYREIADKAGSISSHERMFVPTAYLLSGAALLFLPSALGTVSVTTFGDSNVLSYRAYNTNKLYDAMAFLIRTAGVIWFIRGCVLLAHASEPGVQHGPKGLTFLLAGILAFNFEATVTYFGSAVDKIIAYTTKYG